MGILVKYLEKISTIFQMVDKFCLRQKSSDEKVEWNY